MKSWKAWLLALLVTAAGMGATRMVAAEKEVPAAPTAPAAVDVRAQVKQLRGKLLYKRSQIRKLERAAEAADAKLKAQIAELEAKRQAAYVAAQPKLGGLYAEERELQKQIEALVPTKQ